MKLIKTQDKGGKMYKNKQDIQDRVQENYDKLIEDGYENG
jgi:hypothetical protein